MATGTFAAAGRSAPARAGLAELGRRLVTTDALGARFARGAFWCLADAALAQGFRLLAFLIAVRFLGKEGFGELSIIYNTAGVAGIFAGAGLGVTAARHVALVREAGAAPAARILTLCTLLGLASGALGAVAVWAAAPWLASELLGARHLTSPLALAALLVLCGPLAGVQSGALAGLEAFRTSAATSLVNGILTVVLIGGGAAVSGTPGAVAGLVLAALVSVLVTRAAVAREFRRHGLECWRRPGRAEARILLGFSVAALLGSSMKVPFTWLASTILVRQPSGFAEMGLFSAANQFRLLIAFVPGVLERTALPILHRLRGASEAAGFRRLFAMHLLVSAGGAACLALPIALASPWLMQLYGRGFREGWPLVPPLVAAAVLAAANSAVGAAMVSRNLIWRSALFNGIWGATLIAAARLLIPGYGARGLAWSLLVAYLVHTAVQASCWRRLGKAVPEEDVL